MKHEYIGIFQINEIDAYLLDKTSTVITEILEVRKDMRDQVYAANGNENKASDIISYYLVVAKHNKTAEYKAMIITGRGNTHRELLGNTAFLRNKHLTISEEKLKELEELPLDKDII